MSNLDEIKIMSVANFDTLTATDDNKLYFVEDGIMNTLATSGTINLVDGTTNRITPSAAVTFSLPAVSTTDFHQILVQVNMTTVYSITLGTTYYFNATAPDMSAVGVYNLLFEYDNANGYWVVGCVKKGVAS